MLNCWERDFGLLQVAICIILASSLSKVTAPQDAHARLVLQVYLLEFSAIRRQYVLKKKNYKTEGFRDQDLFTYLK